MPAFAYGLETGPSSKPERHPVYYFKDGMIFLVENHLFKVPRNVLEINSTVFSDMFSLPCGEDTEGFTDVNPIRLPEQVTSIDFQRLLGLLYPLTTKYETFMEPWGWNTWMSILNLATMWDMTEVRNKAIEKLNTIDKFPSPIVQIQYGRKYAYPPWIRAGFLTLVTRDATPLSESEGLVLGMRDALRCAEARERILMESKSSNSGSNADDILDEVFGKDIPKRANVAVLSA